MASHRVVIPPHVMRQLRELIPAPTYMRAPQCRQEDAARMLGVCKRTVAGWESEGSVMSNGWAYVGLATRFGHGTAALQTLAQAELPGSAVWGRATA